MYSRFRSVALGVLLLLSAGGTLSAQRELRVCADPDNLPYSHENGSGFENRIAQLVADELDARLIYSWAPQRRGYVRKNLNAGLCDVLVGVPAHYDPVRTTQPYYRSTYVFAFRANGPFRVHSFDDPQLAKAKIGVQLVGDDLAATPPGHALAGRGFVRNVIGYPPFGDRPQAQRMLDALAGGELDVALVWGPPAAYFARNEPVPLELAQASAPPEIAGIPFEYSIAMGVRKRDTQLQQELDRVIVKRRSDIDAILREYGVPRPADATPLQQKTAQ